MISSARYDRAIAHAYELAADGHRMGLAITISAGDFQIPRGRFVRRLRERRIARELGRRQEAAGMWWNNQ